MKHYKLKLADKAALLNKLEKVGVQVDNFDIKDNKLDDTFEFDIEDPEAAKMVDAVIKQSPKIDKLKEVLRHLVREELKKKK
jgi:hypothetical protein